MSKRWIVAVAVAILTSAGGCRGLATPNFAYPGTADQQQRRALQYDPYPESGPGPEIVGSRPPAYEKAVAEDQRARWRP